MAKNGFVYIMKPTHSNVYKIGETDNLERRKKQLEKKFDFKLEFVFYHPVEDSFISEDHLHIVFSRFHLGGDWFSLTDEALMQVIEMLKGMR